MASVRRRNLVLYLVHMFVSGAGNGICYAALLAPWLSLLTQVLTLCFSPPLANVRRAGMTPYCSWDSLRAFRRCWPCVLHFRLESSPTGTRTVFCRFALEWQCR